MTNKHLLKQYRFFLCWVCLIIAACGEVPQSGKIEAPLKPYAEFTRQLRSEKRRTIQKQSRFFEYINTDIPAYWKGTVWNFNGTTRQPRNGSIACGYFITNVLADFGIELKRVYLAQQPSSVMIKKLCVPGSIKTFASVTRLEQYLKSRNEKEIYIAGLDFHTGFIIRDKDNCYFLHSNYINHQGVVKEKLADSKALNASKSFMVGSLSENAEVFE